MTGGISIEEEMEDVMERDGWQVVFCRESRVDAGASIVVLERPCEEEEEEGGSSLSCVVRQLRFFRAADRHRAPRGQRRGQKKRGDHQTRRDGLGVHSEDEGGDQGEDARASSRGCPEMWSDAVQSEVRVVAVDASDDPLGIRFCSTITYVLFPSSSP
jgi:hypothetical protein